MHNKERFSPRPGSEVWLLCLALAAMIAAYLVIPGAAVAAGSEPAGVARALASATGIAAGIGMVLFGVRRITGSWHETLALLKLDRFLWRGAGRALWLAPALLLSAGVITALWMYGGTQLGIKFSVPPATQALSTGPMAARACLALGAVLLAPLFEELVFRRALYGALAAKCPAALAAVLTSLAFSAMHLSLLQLPGLGWIAWNWQRVADKDNSLWSPVLCHALNNLIAVGLLFVLEMSGCKADGWM